MPHGWFVTAYAVEENGRRSPMPNRSPVEACFVQAMAIAQQQAKLWEWRATPSLTHV